MRELTSLIVGFGEIGKSLYNIIGGDKIDKGEEQNDFYDILHICFPYSKNFIKVVRDYQDTYLPKYTIIHSTVPIGVSAKCDAYYSPVRGIHPRLEEGLLTFIKYLAPPSKKLKEYFEKAGIPIKLIVKRETAEALKLWDTTQYGLFQILEKQIYRFCEKHKLDYKIIYNHANKTYNEGYWILDITKDRGDVTRPTLKHKKGGISGHCVLPNCDLLKDPITAFIKKINKTF